MGLILLCFEKNSFCRMYSFCQHVSQTGSCRSRYHTDGHRNCPNHRQCTCNKRCEICIDWSTEKWTEYSDRVAETKKRAQRDEKTTSGKKKKKSQQKEKIMVVSESGLRAVSSSELSNTVATVAGTPATKKMMILMPPPVHAEPGILSSVRVEPIQKSSGPHPDDLPSGRPRPDGIITSGRDTARPDQTSCFSSRGGLSI